MQLDAGTIQLLAQLAQRIGDDGQLSFVSWVAAFG